MPLAPDWYDIAIRLVLTLLAGALIGANRGLHGHAAGLRTMILVGLAAAVAMIQANQLLSLSGKTQESFAVMDLMRLPLGILTGVGFIGAGTIFKKGSLVTGITTAATLWVMTVIGLCFGGGQLILGGVATLLVVATLWALKWFDVGVPQSHLATLVVSPTTPGAERTLDDLISASQYRADFLKMEKSETGGQEVFTFEISWKERPLHSPPGDLLSLLATRFEIKSFELISGKVHE